MKKNDFLTFLFSFMPGCGHMYLGAMKKGTTLLTSFWAVIFVASWLNLGFLFFLLPVLWFYSFFDAMNLRLCHYEYIRQVDNQFGRQLSQLLVGEWKPQMRRRHVLVGTGCILLGLYLTLANVISPYLYEFPLPEWVYGTIRRLPTLVLAIVIIVLGIRLIRKKEIKTEDPADFTEYKGEDHDESN